MIRRHPPLAIALASLLAGAPLPAQQHDEAHHHAVGKLGRVVFPVSCSPEAQRRFEQAMAVLHSFWWEEGDRAFNRVLASDSACAMAHWGLALNAWGNPFGGGPSGAGLAKGAQAAQRAAALPAKTARERGLIAATAALYRNAESTSNADRLQAYADTMARLRRDLPGDLEVGIYYALSLVATAPRTDTTLALQRKAIGILSPLYARHPEHPGLAHYVIHATDSPRLAKLGLPAARRYARIAPAAPHAQHMPSHIFVRLGLWSETVGSNWKSYQAGMDYGVSVGMPGGTSHELHALDYAVYGYLQRGQDSAARAALVAAGRVKAPDTRAVIAGYNGTAMKARILLEPGNWRAAAAFPAPADTSSPMAAALSRFTRAIGSARNGSAGAASAEVTALGAIADSLEAKKEAYWSRVVRIKQGSADAWAHFAAGDTAAALDLARAAADSEEVTDKHPVTPAELLPARELQADILLAVGHYKEAREAYQMTLAREPGRARSMFGAARAAELAGDQAAAADGYREFLRLMEHADGGRGELGMARGFVTSAGSR